MFVTSKKAQEFHKVSGETLRQWAIKGEIEFITTKKGHRRYKIIPIGDKTEQRERYIYARVSSSKQKRDLQKQISFLTQEYPEHKVISDVGSGISIKRKGFKTLLEQILEGNVEEIVVANKDRLSRFSFKLIQLICRKFGTRIIVANKQKTKSDNEELADDIISIITVFTAKYYGSRKYKLLTKDPNIS